MNRTTKLVTAFGALAIVVAACGGGATEAPAETGTPATEAPEATPVPEFPTGDFDLTLWTKEGEADGSLQYVQGLADAYTALRPNVKITVVNKDVEALREDFQTASLAGDPPEILWTVADHVGPFTAADLILPLGDMTDPASYVPAAADIVTVDGTLWGAPVSFGNQLMLYWNKELVGDEAPADTDALIAKAKELTGDGNYGLVFNQTESFWMFPWLGGFGGSVFAEDGVTPTLDTEAMTNTFQFMYDLKYTDKIMPAEADYNVADGLFKDGKAAMIINGDWTLSAYSEVFGDKLGVGPIPQITGFDYPAPYVAGTFIMVAKAVGDNPDLQTVVADFIKFATSEASQVDMVQTLKRLPGNASAIEDTVVIDDPLLGGAALAATKGVPQPTNLEMRCVFDSATAAVRDMYTGNSDIAGIVSTMQTATETCISQL
jgi:arabinogalactan oligomer/maltooligosaccharide transport system substrate-binding protein